MIEFLERYTVINFESGIPNFKHSKELTEENFEQVAMNKDEDGKKWFLILQIVFVHFYTTWDGHSEKVFGELEKAAYLLRKTKHVTLTKMDVTNSDKIKQKFELEGFPRFILFPAFNKRDFHFYSGNRMAESFVMFIEKYRGVRPLVPEFVHHPEETVAIPLAEEKRKDEL
jgi:thiol-disulfide isomerase/thioredoxin